MAVDHQVVFLEVPILLYTSAVTAENVTAINAAMIAARIVPQRRGVKLEECGLPDEFRKQVQYG